MPVTDVFMLHDTTSLAATRQPEQPERQADKFTCHYQILTTLRANMSGAAEAELPVDSSTWSLHPDDLEFPGRSRCEDAATRIRVGCSTTGSVVVPQNPSHRLLSGRPGVYREEISELNSSP